MKLAVRVEHRHRQAPARVIYYIKNLYCIMYGTIIPKDETLYKCRILLRIIPSREETTRGPGSRRLFTIISSRRKASQRVPAPHQPASHATSRDPMRPITGYKANNRLPSLHQPASHATIRPRRRTAERSSCCNASQLQQDATDSYAIHTMVGHCTTPAGASRMWCRECTTPHSRARRDAADGFVSSTAIGQKSGFLPQQTAMRCTQGPAP